MKNFAQKYLRNVRLFLILFAAILIGGLLSFLNLPREMTPAIDLPILGVYALYPGASSADVEELVTTEIETALKSVKGIDTVTSIASDNVSISIIQFTESVNLDDAYNQVSQKMNQIRTFPTGVEKPELMKIDFDDTPIWMFNLEGPDASGLNTMADQLAELIEAEPLIDRVEVIGNGEREIQLILNQEKVNQLGLNPAMISGLLQLQLTNMPAGTVQLNDYQLPITIDKSITDLDSLRATPIRVNGTLYQLGDLVAIAENEKPGATQSFQLEDGQIRQTVALAVYKMAGQPIDRSTAQAQQVVTDYLANNQDYRLTTTLDTGQEITDTFNDLTDNIIATIVLVFIVMFLFLGFKEAFVSAMSIPTVMLLTFMVMQIAGISLNMISLMALLLALGLLVDNAIVVVTALNRAYRQNKGRQTALQAAVSVWQEFFAALISTNLTTIWAFLPLLMMTGIMGKFIQPLPIVVTVAILSSALVAFFICLPLGVLILDAKLPTRIQKLILGIFAIAIVAGVIYLLPTGLFAWIAAVVFLIVFWLAARLYFSQRHQSNPQSLWQKFKTKAQTGFINIEKLENGYKKLLTKILANAKLQKRILTMIIIVTVVAFILPFTPAIKTEFMPADPAATIYVDVELPVGTSTRVTQEEMVKMLTDFEGFTGAKHITASLGGGSNGIVSMGTTATNQFQLTINLIDEKTGDFKPLDPTQVASDLRQQYANYQPGQVTVSLDQGMMSQMGADVQISLMGPDKDELGIYAQQIADYLTAVPGTTNVVTSAQENPSKLSFIPNQQQLTDAGLTSQDVYTQLNTALNGRNLGAIQIDGQEYDLTFRFEGSEADYAAVEKLLVVSPITGQALPISSLGHFVLQPNLGTVNYQDYQPVQTISAATLPGFSGTEINRNLQDYVQNELDLPADYQIATGGMNEIFDESINSLGIAMIVAVALILFTLVMQLGSFRQAAIVMSVIPVSISGVFILFGLLGISLSIPSLIGILALFGIVVNNSILIIERINQNLAEGQDFKTSIIDGAQSRLQPILMTSLTTIIGLLPISISNIMWRGLGGAIIAGLTFSGILLLLFIPILYYQWFNAEHLIQKDIRWLKWKEKWLGIERPKLN